MLIAVSGGRILFRPGKVELYRHFGAGMDTGIACLTLFRIMDGMLIFQMDAASRTYSGTNPTANTFVSHLKICPYRLRRIFHHL
jgi:hypothetical protein